MPAIRVDRRFRGPNTSGNGGVTCGLIAAHLPDAAEVTLRAPPPLDVDLDVTEGPKGVHVHHGEVLIATARPTELALEAPPNVGYDAAAAAVAAFRNQDEHPLPQCFVCGTHREPDDGLCIFPGPVAGTEVVAAPWTPHASVGDDEGLVPAEIVWGALDCPSFFAFVDDAPFALLGRLAARIARRPAVGERCVVLGFVTAPRDGRKLYGGAAVYGEDDALLAVSRATWIEVDRATVPT